VAAVSVLPLSGDTEDWAFSVEKYVPPEGKSSITTEQTRFVSGDYFGVLGIELVAGRKFELADDGDHPLVAIVSESFARKHWKEEGPIGKRIKLFSQRGEAPWITIVGMVKDIRHLGLASEQQPFVYYPFAQSTRSTMTMVMRSSADAGSTATAIRQALSTIDSEQPFYSVRTMNDYATQSISQFRFTSIVLTLIGMLALMLAGIGVYGLMAFAVNVRRHEFGVRMALGAERSQVLRDVLRHGFGLACAGVAIGLAGAVAAADTLREQLYEVGPRDPIALGVVAFVLLAIATAACVFPAIRATRIDPASALRSD